MKTYIQTLALAASLLVLVVPAFATNVESGSEVTISSPMEGNLYVGAGKVFINARINGDLLAGCGIPSWKMLLSGAAMPASKAPSAVTCALVLAM